MGRSLLHPTAMQEDARYQNEAALDPTPQSSWGKLLHHVPDGARVLEVGCAHGAFSHALKRLKHCHVTGVELDPARAATAATRADEVLTGDIDALMKAGAVPADFDVVIAADVLEHLAKPGEVLKGLATRLKKGGVLLCSIPNVAHMSVMASLLKGSFPRSKEGLLDATHVHFFGEADVRALFRDAGYAVQIVDRVQLDPRHTEFKTDLPKLPAEALELFDRDPNALTYQFIVRAVPRAWAGKDDDREAEVAAPSLKHHLVGEVEKLEAQVGEYHRALTAREAEVKALAWDIATRTTAHAALQDEATSLHARLGQAHRVIQDKDTTLAASEAAWKAQADAQHRDAEALHEKLRGYHTALANKDVSIAELHAEAVALKARAAELSAAIEARDTLIAELRRALDEARAAVKALDAKAAEAAAHEAKRRSLEAELALKDEEPDLALLRVLYVAQRDDASFRYRCVQGAEQLREAGVVANVARLDAEDLLTQVTQYSLIVLFRLPWSDRVAQVIDAARAGGARIAFEIDDLIFHPDAEALMPFLKRTSPSDLREYRRQFLAHQKTLLAADVCVASTPTIARHARAQGKVAVVHPNLLPSHYLQLGKVIHPLRPALMRTPLIGYMSGSRTHDGDVAQVADALAVVLAQHPDASLLFCGPLHVPPKLFGLLDRIIRFPYQDHRVYPWLMARCRLLIAPLETTNDFANAKSALKVFEAGVFGIPVVATPTGPYRDAIVPGVTGALASTTAEWVDGISTLLDFRTSQKFGAAARDLALRRFSMTAHRGALATKLARFAGDSDFAPPEASPLALPADPRTVKARAQEAAAIARSSLSAAIRDPQVSARAVRGLSAAILYADVLDEGNPVSQALVAMKREGRTLLDAAGETIGTLLADFEHPLTPASDHVVAKADRVGFQAIGNDPYFLPPPLKDGPRRTLVVEMAVQPPAEGETANAQVFWRTASEEAFSEANSLIFPLEVDGKSHVYVIDLLHQLGARWPAQGELMLRFDPIDRPADFEISRVALLGALPEGQADVRRGLGGRFLKGEGLEIGALQNPMPVPEAATVRYVDRLSLADLRKHYPELDGQPLVDPAILADADQLTPVDDDSVDFVITNHVLEHLRDPLSGLAEWIRVLKPGGHLYVSIPDQSNPYDKDRAVTSMEHLRADRDDRANRGAEDAAHAHDWTKSAHPTMSPEEQVAFSEKLITEKYDIHFHVFDGQVFRQMLAEVCGPRAELREFLSVGEEHHAILRKRAPAEKAGIDRGVDIVIPIYNARDFTVRCIESVLAHATGDWRLILVNDASTQAGVAEDLARFAAEHPKKIVLLTNEVNLGFVMTANRGMREAKGRDVLLLNSDTEVFSGFLDRLRAAAWAEQTTGILTPFSNNATLCSIPNIGVDNPIPEGFTPARFAELVAAASKRRRPELVTGVGFCMYVKNEVFERIGYFDEVSYGRGFGEENDLCERAKKAGFTIRLADDVFVQHKGKASFGAEGQALESKNGKILEGKHPGYNAAVAHWFRVNPLAAEHEEIRTQMRRLKRGSEEAVLILLHATIFGSNLGGTEFHVRDMIRSLKLPRVVVGYPDGPSLVAAEVLDGEVHAPTFYRFPLSKQVGWFCVDDDEITGTVKKWVELFGIRAVHIHHLLYWPVSVAAALHEIGVPYAYTSHDFYAVCPSWNLFDFEKRAVCACTPGGAGCVEGTLKTMGAPPTDAAGLRVRHRAAFLELFKHAKAIVFPSSAARDRAHHHLGFDLKRAHVLPHGTDSKLTVERPPRGEKLRVAVVGEVAFPIKGADNYVELVKQCVGLPIEWHFFGTTNVHGFEERLRAIEGAQLAMRGRYKREAIADLLATSGIDLCVLLPEADETFSFVLSESVIAHIPVVALRKGALPERIAAGKFGVVVDSVAGARDAIARLASDAAALEELTAAARRFHHASVADNAAELGKLYDALGFTAQPRPLPIRPEAVQELIFRRIVPQEPPVPSGGVPQEDRPPGYQSSWWYPLFKRVKTLIPEDVRQKGREQLVLREKVTLHPVRRNELSDIDLIKQGRRTVRFESKSNDPFIVFEARPIVARDVKTVRFRLKHDLEHYAQAQLFWTHATGESFTEVKSVRVPLQPGKWVQYAIRTDSPELAAAWRDGNEIIHMRFDPVDMPGAFEMGPLELLF